MDHNISRPDLLPLTVSSLLLWIMTVAGIITWIIVHRKIVRKTSLRREIRMGILLPSGFVASWLMMQLLGRYVFLAGSTPLLVMALVSALSIELISMLYRRECDLLPKRDGRLLVAFRMSAVLILIFMLLQPVLVGELTRTISRRVVVLLDDSASMNFKDKYWTLEERIEVAVALGALEDARDADFTEAIREVPGLADDFSFYRIVDESKTDEEGSGLDNKKVGETAKKALSVLKPLHEKFGGMVETLPQEEFGELRETVSKSSSMLEKTLLPTLEKLKNESGKADASLGNAVSTCANNFNKLSEALPKLERAFMVSAYNKLEEEKDRNCWRYLMRPVLR